MGRIKTRITKILDENNIEYVIKLHSKKVYTCEDAARERCVRIEQIVKCMIVKDSRKRFYIALLPGNRKLNLKKFAKLLNLKKVSMASPGEIEKITDSPVGAISPLSLKPKDIKIFLDNSIQNEDIVDISSGKPDAGVELKLFDLISLLKPEIANISE